LVGKQPINANLLRNHQSLYDYFARFTIQRKPCVHAGFQMWYKIRVGSNNIWSTFSTKLGTFYTNNYNHTPSLTAVGNMQNNARWQQFLTENPHLLETNIHWYTTLTAVRTLTDGRSEELYHRTTHGSPIPSRTRMWWSIAFQFRVVLVFRENQL